MLARPNTALQGNLVALTETKRVGFRLPRLIVSDILADLGYFTQSCNKGVDMDSKATFVFSKARILIRVSAVAMFALALAKPSQSGQTPDIFHHWPHLAMQTETNDDTMPDIFHHWPHLTTSATGKDSRSAPDIFHHWPYLV